MSKITEGTIFGVTLEDTVGKIADGSIKMIIIEIVAITEVEIGPERDHSQEAIAVTELEIQTIVDQGQDPELVLIGIG